MPARAARKPKQQPAAVEPVPDLTVSAVVTVFVDMATGEARVVVKVDYEGHQALVERMKLSNGKATIAGQALRRVVTQALTVEQIGPTVDLLAVSQRAGRV